jgi:hypothetical protein
MDMADLLDERLPALMHGLETVLNDASAPDAVKAMVEGKIKARRCQRRTNA